MPRSTVLVVEDDAAIRRGISDSLSYAGHEVIQCADGRDVVQLVIESTIDLVLLDIMLPGVDGFTILDDLRRHQPTLPVIMVTARGAEEDRVRGLHNGADDYVVKPFSAKELLARVDAVLRRSPERPDQVRRIRADSRSIDLARREAAFTNGTVIALSEREVSILHYLAGHHGRAVDRDELLRHVWGLNPRGLKTRTVDMHIARLREKLCDDSFDKPLIQTVRGKGYMICDTAVLEKA